MNRHRLLPRRGLKFVEKNGALRIDAAIAKTVRTISLGAGNATAVRARPERPGCHFFFAERLPLDAEGRSL